MKSRHAKRYLAMRKNPFVLIGVLVLLAVTVPLYSVSSSSRGSADKSKPLGSENALKRSPSSSLAGLLKSGPPLAPPISAETIATFDSTCTTPQDSFNLGDTVCAVVTNAPLPFNGQAQTQIGWVSPYGALTQGSLITTNPQHGFYTVPATQTQQFSENRGPNVVTFTVDNRGTWNVGLFATSDGSRQATAFFTVHDPTTPFVDESVNQFTGNTEINAGSSGKFSVFVSNRGPDSAQNVVFTDDVPNDSTLVAFTQTSGPTFSCTGVSPGGTGTITCTIASLARGGSASFDMAFNVNGTAAVGTNITNNAAVSSDTSELVPDDNSSSSSVTVTNTGGGGGTCTVACPDDITVPANTVDGSNNPGATVHFSPPSGNDGCGTITTDHCNDCFFPVGSTVVTATGTGDSCSFTVTVTANGLSISCPASQTANADNNCQASLNAGTATATGGDNITITATRSDGLAMYNCDANGTNCTRRSSDFPFATGVTKITWTAYSHDQAGPYQSADDEEAHRTGSASCTQTVTVNDVTPPTITASDVTASADANCQAAVPDFSTLAVVSDNCACASSDTSDVCNSRQDIRVTQDVAAGTLLGLGAHTIHLTANDGSSNNGGAGNTSIATVTLTVVDTTPPSFTFVPANVTAYTGPGASTCDAVVDPGTATANDNCGTVTITRSPSGNTFGVGTTTITWTARDGTGNTSTATQTVTVVDNTLPVISCPANVTVYLPLHTTATSMAVTYPAATATDNCGVASIGYTAPSGSVFPVGTTSVTATATDVNGNAASCSFTVTVLYDFTGFFAPVNNPPTLNVVNAGRGIPVKFSLSGNKGLGILAATSPQSGLIACDASAPATDLTDTITAGGSSLSYDPTSDQYVYVWKTDSSWAGTCRQLVVTLNDGSVHVANFKFK